MRRFDLNSESVRMCLGRVATLLTVTFFVTLLSAAFADWAHADVLEVRIASGNDDAEEPSLRELVRHYLSHAVPSRRHLAPLRGTAAVAALVPRAGT